MLTDTETKDGGPAFGHGAENGHCCGMTIRDYFAAKAMAAFLTSPSHAGETAVESPAQCAEWAYQQADAMLAKRKE